MVQLLFTANLMLTSAFALLGIIMLVGMAMDAVSNLKDNEL